MARPNQEAIETFMSITGASESVALQKLEEHGGDLNEAVNAHFNEGDRSIIHEISTAAPQNDAMDIDEPIQVGLPRLPFSLLPSTRNLNPFSLLDPDFSRSLFDSGPDLPTRAPFVSHPREVREIPIEVKDGSEQEGHSGLVPSIEDVTETAQAQGPETHGTVIIDEDDDEDIPTAPSGHAAGQNEQENDALGNNSRGTYPMPTAPGIDDLPDYSNDIEEEMVRAAIEASKREVGKGYLDQQFDAPDYLSNPGTQQRQSHLEDAELAHAVSLSMKAVEQEKALLEAGEKGGASELEPFKSTELGDMGKMTSSNGSWRQVFVPPDKCTSRQSRLDVGSSSIQEEAEDVEEQPLVRHRSRRMPSASVDSAKEIGEVEITPPSSPGQDNSINHPPHNANDFQSDEWGGISSEEHDEAIMLEAALFGGMPGGSEYRFPYAPHQLMQNGLDRNPGPYPLQMPRPPSPGLTAQRLIREQQDDEYLASLQADREKELKAIEEADARRLEEQAAREAALEEERRMEEESRRKLEEEQEIERQLAAKEASLPQEPSPEDEKAVTLLVRMPDGSRHGRRFLKSDKLQSLFDFIDVGRRVKPGTYRLVRPYPRRAFSDGESVLTLSELGLIGKQEALFLELI
ncbi:plant UBX domain-containing protein 8-like isoform X1 [Camellia sinensis]|uniref:plant UBX domain-containing protein 8-like isoform X1 n=2 Tax=Camellia sinensis TaxID=4442 RepID=UPI001035AE6D|nr:plant UBX domain-containing protein 8-like isoform X1 [Camellia sinensis]